MVVSSYCMQLRYQISNHQMMLYTCFVFEIKMYPATSMAWQTGDGQISPTVTVTFPTQLAVAVANIIRRVNQHLSMLLLEFFSSPSTAYDGPQSYDLNNPDSTTTKVHVLNVTPDASKTENFTDSSDDDIPTINTGKIKKRNTLSHWLVGYS